MKIRFRIWIWILLPCTSKINEKIELVLKASGIMLKSKLQP